MDTKLIARYAIRETMGIVIMGVALLVPAGQIDWWPAWAAIAVMAAWVIATAIVILRFNPDLLAERLGPHKGSKAWDTAIMSVVGLVQLGRYVVAGLDQRYGWTGGLPLAVQIMALIVCVLSYALVVWATASNRFFSQMMRIQSERDHAVATGGPYHYVRHPAYVGTILYEVAVPILLGSWWALLISGLNVILLIVRTALEDRTLQAELTGYAECAIAWCPASGEPGPKAEVQWLKDGLWATPNCEESPRETGREEGWAFWEQACLGESNPTH
jgi:protein-S-isoprenylcysteine O-methyltransferase Ste14